MLKRVYKTVDEGEITVLRPETAWEAGILYWHLDNDSPPTLDARHSFGDGRSGEKKRRRSRRARGRGRRRGSSRR